MNTYRSTYRSLCGIRSFLMLCLSLLRIQYSLLSLLVLFTLSTSHTSAQIVIGGNVYGGGNEGDTEGSTTVTIRTGRIKNVFGGARMADVHGRAFVNIDGENGSGVILIASVYGGNDISGTVGTSVDPDDTGFDKVPAKLTDVLRGTTDPTHKKNDINNSWCAFVRTSPMKGVESHTNMILIGSVYGGGNGDYSYDSREDFPESGQTTHYIYEAGNATPIATKVTATGEAGFSEPELAKTYLELNGGCMSQVYGGGNAATVTEETTISMNNTSKGMQSLFPPRDPDTQTQEEYINSILQQVAYLSDYMGISTFQSDLSSLDYTSARVFGGNNKATMAIHPHWNLQGGLIRDLYSGGNQGDMTNTWGLLLEIPAYSNIKVENVYGGCRRADVHPAVSDAALPDIQVPAKHVNFDGEPYQFPKGYSARVIVRGGDINNVYGGNDISGNIWGGSAVGVYTSIRGDVYGAGNGSYAYTDNSNLEGLPGYGDFYYDVNKLLGHSAGSSFSSEESAQALSKHRPHSERVSLRLWGSSADNPTIIGGSVYVGGNSATLKNDRDPNKTATGELRIGSYVYANNVYLGNNGVQMTRPSVLKMYKDDINISGTNYPYSQIDLTESSSFAEYMNGCASYIKPDVVFDKRNEDGSGDPDTYQEYTTYFGNFFCGGNVGSMMWSGTDELHFDHKFTIFNKLVAGCNDAYVPVQKDENDVALNAEYHGGVLGSLEEQAPGAMVETVNGVKRIKNAYIINLSGIQIEPKRWALIRDANYQPVLVNGQVQYKATDGCALAEINDVCQHNKHAYLIWNTIDHTGDEVQPQTTPVASNYVSNTDDLNRRLQGGNVYGGCYNSGIVNGSVEINIDKTLMNSDVLFDKVAEDDLGEAILYGAGGLNDLLAQDKQNFHILERRTGVIRGRQGMDVLGKALNIFGGGYGENTEIWGSTTINLNAGFVFQIFGGGEKGVIGKPYDSEQGATEHIVFNGNTYLRNSLYSCTVNLRGTKAGVSKKDDSSEDMAECEFIYGGGFLGPICGNTKINLGNGRVFDTFAGSCNADILGHTETYIGVQVDKKGDETGEGFPYVRDYTYCGNDLGGRILGSANFVGRVRSDVASMVHSANVTKASAYTEYRQGRAEGIFGGCFGTYDYTDPYYGEFFYASDATDISSAHPVGSARDGYTKPRMGNAFVNFRPTDEDALLIGANKYNFVNSIYGAGQGYPSEADRDIMQKSSYVLIDVPSRMTNYQNMQVFGAGAWSGLGMDEYLPNKTKAEIEALSAENKAIYYSTLDGKSAIIDLMRGQVGAAWGGSYAEGVTRRTVVNVPTGSTIRIGSIFGGAYGTETYMPCDVYESNVEYHSADATLIYNPVRVNAETGLTEGNPLQNGAIYGGNNNERRTLYTKVNIDTPVNQAHYQYGASKGNVYGAGLGSNTWAEYTEVNLNDGAEVYEVYGGGQAGKVLNAETIQQFRSDEKPATWPTGTIREGETFTDADWDNAWAIGSDYDDPSKEYWENNKTNLANPLVRVAEVDDRDWRNLATEHIPLIVNKYNTNVIINEGALVANYGYGAGLGADATVAGHTYIALLGGKVAKDIYAGGTSGPVEDMWNAGIYHSTDNDAGFVATTTAYIQGGTVRNVYGGGWRGAVGHHVGAISDPNTGDVPGESHVVIGKRNGTSYIDGIPSVTRNVYGGGEGGGIFGTAFVKINNGYIGYRYNSSTGKYDPELDDVAPGDNLLDKGGNVFGGGYVANSYTDISDVQMYGGTVRGCLFGGGEIGPIGRGTVKGNPEGIIYKAGIATVTLYDGHVLRDVFGGGRGYDNWNGEGYMTEEEKQNMDLSSKGYVFGRTFVWIRGGEIGTDDGVAKGFGNVFGGGDRGLVYSGYEGGRGKKSGARYDDGDEGYYYKYENDDYVLSGTEKVLTEDCKVVIGPQCLAKENITLTGVFYPYRAPIPDVDIKYLMNANPNRTDITADGHVAVQSGITIPSRTYQAGDYVPTYALQTLKGRAEDASQWAKLKDDGVTIHNAVFAGGNVSSGDDQVYANAPTVFGNATASIHDLFHRDLVTIGTGHVGGLYGDGNLTFVDGYRGLNITNYGTDFNNLNRDIDYETYKKLTDRERAYYEIRYKCVQTCTDKQGKSYSPGTKITFSDLEVLFEWEEGATYTNVFNSDGSVNSAYWEQSGFCSLYAGRIMNTIQRADFCGVFGSRMVLQGAPDRVPETVDYTNYTINRVREVSLNKKRSIIPSDAGTDHEFNGNYFGIYSFVNHLGALTSDVNMEDVRVTGNSDYPNDYTGQTYYDYKKNHSQKRNRNRGGSHNKVALASGVYLELTTEKSTGKGVHEKDWGYVTGVIELDLINIQTGLGGGYVYAKNVHGKRSDSGKQLITLTALNNDAVTRKSYIYSDDTNKNASDIVNFETSGNFIHDAQTIIDDCYDVGASYKGNDRSPAHYWYIKGQIYVYEQYISAYTGAPAAYKERVNIPLSITASSNGKLKLLNIQPNYYAYYKMANTPLAGDDVLEINDKTYGLNDPIDYWSYNLLTPAEKDLFVPMTYTTIAKCTINGVTYPKGKVMLPSEYTALKNSVTTNSYTVHNNETDHDDDFDFIFRQTNNISHGTGYILTYDVDNPMQWDNWYSPKAGSSSANKISTEDYDLLSGSAQSNYYDGPTYSVKAGEQNIYGQHTYKVSDIINHEVYTSYQTLISSHTIPDDPNTTEDDQADFKPAYVVTVDQLDTQDKNNNNQRLYKGSALAQENYTPEQWAAIGNSVAPAFVATSTIQISNSEYINVGDLMTEARKNQLIQSATAAGNTTLATTLTNSILSAYYCTSAGLYGGSYYDVGYNYRGLEAWSSMSPEDRKHFVFNYDALDLLIDPNFSGTSGLKYQYDDPAATYAAAQANKAQYSLERPVDYTATYNSSTPVELSSNVRVTRNNTTIYTNEIQQDDELTREVYESLPNEQSPYAPIYVAEAGNVYVVHESFIRGESPYVVGQTLSADEYNALGADQSYVTTLSFDSGDKNKIFFYCRRSYVSQYLETGKKVKSIKGDNSGEYVNGNTIPVGAVIAEHTDGDYTGYVDLLNKQSNFIIHGIAPVETSTFYVARNSDIFDLSEDRIITVIYQYDYEDSDDLGKHIVPVSERHIVNIHLQFKSGVPTVETITAPDLVLPGTNVVIRTPNVTPGAYEVLGGGWEIYRTPSDAENHVNGTEYSPSTHPLYWYQDGYQVAYYAMTYLGKSFSNFVPLKVANYHDLKKVMDDKDNHYYIDNTDAKRDPKIYINDYTTDDPTTTDNGLTLLKNLFDLSFHQATYDSDNNPVPISGGTLDGHNGVNTSQIGGAKNLEFFLRTDLAAPSGESWTPIGADTQNSTTGKFTECFEGTLHGDGHVISGLDNSLFKSLCGEIYNLGVTGTFTTAGIVDTGTGYLENCWIKTEGTPAAGIKPLFNAPARNATIEEGKYANRLIQMVNCYYPEENQYTDHADDATYGKPTRKPLLSFYNGEVTYDLNEFYLFKRYCDNNSSITGNDYSYWIDGGSSLVKQTGHYSATEGPYLVENALGEYVGSYVESRFADGDFIYAGGTIPSSEDKRFDNTDKKHYPIWPDDYFFFGQTLTYGHADPRAHQPLPSMINRNGDRLPNVTSTVISNRVYRAPAYYRSLAMGIAYFNPNAIFAQSKNGDATLIAHKNMTAIDFTGANGDLASGYQKGLQAAVTASASVPGGLPERFYPPILDDDGIFSIQNIDLTRNLLVYTGATGGTGSGQTPTASQQTANVVGAYLLDQAYVETNPTTYRTVAVYDTYSDRVLGHWVQGSGSAYTAPRDHMLVDKHDFNAPISYTFNSGKRMWYQRTPDTFVDRKQGWEGISLPFSAEIVTTQTKGELTHFYETSTEINGVNVGATGHEYWLRHFVSGGTPEGNIYKAAFNHPDAGTNTKEYTNTFLYDYYYQYSGSARDDANSDKYQQAYYASSHTFQDYPYSVAGMPYIVGFPGTTYYEFDLSGNFLAENTKQAVSKLAKQTLTFASPTGVTIRVSDKETLPTGTYFSGGSYNGYTFRPSYLNEAFSAGTNTFTLKPNYDSDGDNTADCSSFVKVPATGDATSVSAFRPYFTYTPSQGSTRSAMAITFSGVDSEPNIDIPDYDSHSEGLIIKTNRGQIIVKSGYTHDKRVNIVSAAGFIIASFDIAPGESVETSVPTGVYIVNKTKVVVK